MELRDFSWVHVEGRNKANVLDILAYLDQEKKVKFSVEVEKVNRGFEDFIPFGDGVIISKVLNIVVLGRSSFNKNELWNFPKGWGWVKPQIQTCLVYILVVLI